MATEYTLDFEEAIILLAQALSLKYDIKEPFFESKTRVVTEGGLPRLEAVSFRFYGERQPAEPPPRDGWAEAGADQTVHPGGERPR